jgi:hypothetical protein
MKAKRKKKKIKFDASHFFGCSYISLYVGVLCGLWVIGRSSINHLSIVIKVYWMKKIKNKERGLSLKWEILIFLFCCKFFSLFFNGALRNCLDILCAFYEPSKIVSVFSFLIYFYKRVCEFTHAYYLVSLMD